MKYNFTDASRENLTYSLRDHRGNPNCHIVFSKLYQDFRVIYYLPNINVWEPIEEHEFDITERCMNRGLAHDSIRWSQVLEEVDSIIEEDADYIPVNSFEAMRAKHGLNKRQASEICGIPYRTWLKWESGERTCPEYVERLIEFYLDNRK